MASQIIRKSFSSVNGNILKTVRIQPLFTCSALKADLNDFKKLKEPQQLAEKHVLMKKELLEQQKAYEHGLIKIEKTEPVHLVSGIPEEHIKGRRVRISLASKNPMQSGTDNTHNWVMEFETRERWENPLMGWSSTGDPLSNMSLKFSTKEDAIHFCDKNGWEWFVEAEKPKVSKVKSYGFNFSWNKRTRVSTK